MTSKNELPARKRKLAFTVTTKTAEGETIAESRPRQDPPKPAAPPPMGGQSGGRMKVALPTVAEEEREATLADSDSRYIEIDHLPSGGVFYPFERLSIRRLGVPEVRKAYQAHMTKSFRTFVQILTPSIDRDAYSLTIGDFWYLMYFHQSNSYPKSPATMSFECMGKEHLEKVKNGELEPETLRQKMEVRYKELKEHSINEEIGYQLAELISEVRERFNVTLYPPTVQDTIEMVEEMEALDEKALNASSSDKLATSALDFVRNKSAYADLEWINEYASYLHPAIHGTSIKQRREFLDSLDNDMLELFDYIDRFKKLSQHGIVETVKTKCTVCAAERMVPTSLSAAMFLPDLQRAKLA